MKCGSQSCLGGEIGGLLDLGLDDGRVTHFPNLEIGTLRTGIFDLMDVCIAHGSGLLIAEFCREADQHLSRRAI